jgi:hypothetical protein
MAIGRCNVGRRSNGKGGGEEVEEEGVKGYRRRWRRVVVWAERRKRRCG